MREDPIKPDEPQNFADLPIQPTGSGVQDLEIAYEPSLSRGTPPWRSPKPTQADV